MPGMKGYLNWSKSCLGYCLRILAYCVTDLDWAALLNWHCQQIYLFGWIQTSKTGGQPHKKTYILCTWTKGSSRKLNKHVAYMCFILFFFGGGGCEKHNILPLVPIQPSSPSVKELHTLVYCSTLCQLRTTIKGFCNIAPQPVVVVSSSLNGNWKATTATCSFIFLPICGSKGSWYLPS